MDSSSVSTWSKPGRPHCQPRTRACVLSICFCQQLLTSIVDNNARSNHVQSRVSRGLQAALFEPGTLQTCIKLKITASRRSHQLCNRSIHPSNKNSLIIRKAVTGTARLQPPSQTVAENTASIQTCCTSCCLQSDPGHHAMALSPTRSIVPLFQLVLVTCQVQVGSNDVQHDLSQGQGARGRRRRQGPQCLRQSRKVR